MRRPRLLALLLVGLVACGCQGERREITPTTLGTNLKRLPRGTMTPFSWPGQDIVKAGRPPVAATADPDASLASGEPLAR